MGVYGWLSFQTELALADDVQRQLIQEDAPEMPEEYLLVRKLRTFSGATGDTRSGIPFLVTGGWYDQPHITVLVIEAALAGERRFEAAVTQGKFLDDKSGQLE